MDGKFNAELLEKNGKRRGRGERERERSGERSNGGRERAAARLLGGLFIYESGGRGAISKCVRSQHSFLLLKRART